MQHLILNMGLFDLDVIVEADVDTDGPFLALCLDTGKRIWVNGWLISDIEVVS